MSTSDDDLSDKIEIGLVMHDRRADTVILYCKDYMWWASLFLSLL